MSNIITKQTAIQAAIIGSDDFHTIMRSIALSSFEGQAGFIPQKAPIELCKQDTIETTYANKFRIAIWAFNAATNEQYVTGWVVGIRVVTREPLCEHCIDMIDIYFQQIYSPTIRFDCHRWYPDGVCVICGGNADDIPF